MNKLLALFILLTCFTISGELYAQDQSNLSSLSIKQIMQGEKFIGYSPSNQRWSPDGSSIIFSWNPEMDTLRSTYKVNVDARTISRMESDKLMYFPNNYDISEDGVYAVYGKHGDVFKLNLKTGVRTQILKTSDRESRPFFSNDGNDIVYVKNNNYFIRYNEDGRIEQLTQFVSGNERKEKPLSKTKQWLKDDQLDLIQILDERAVARRLREERSEEQQPPFPMKIYYGKKRINLNGISPDLNHIVYSLTISSGDDRTLVPDYVAESGFTENLYSRPKVGGPQDTYESWVYDRTRDTSYQINTEELPGIKSKPLFLKDYVEEEKEFIDTLEKARDVIILGPVFSDGGKAMVVVRSMDNKDRWICQLDLLSGNLTSIERQRDEAWIGGPGIVSWNFSTGNVGWINESTVFFQSEETGYSHLYTLDINTRKKTALTSGNFEVLDAQLSNDKTTFYLTTNEESPHVQHFYHLPVSGGKPVKITSEQGGHQVEMSPDESRLAIRYSTSNTPWELFVMDNQPGAEMIQLTESTTDAFNQYEWVHPEIIRFKARDGVEVPARIYRPDDNKKNGAGVVFVHGAGYLQNVHHWWSGYYREFMFHNFLRDQGYTVIDIDYRASAGYGRDWRTAIYRWMGGHDLNDNIDGAKYLVENEGVDPERIGIYGGSYGGFITLMAMFNAPEQFKAGAALRSVTDWAHYNHGYTSNILNTPTTDPNAYRKSSPIYFAEGLKNHLLMLHGMVDRNVQFQDVVRLSQRLIELEKENWELAVFPMEGHGFVEPSSWTDEYRRIYELFQKHLR